MADTTKMPQGNFSDDAIRAPRMPWLCGISAWLASGAHGKGSAGEGASSCEMRQFDSGGLAMAR